MRNRVVSLVGLAIFAMPVAAVAAGEAHAPPTLTPLVARDVAYACPGTAKYAGELVRGITETDAAAAAPLFDACAAGAKRDFTDVRRQLASTAVGAAYLSLGLLRHDPALLRRSIDATAEVRRNFLIASDDDVRRWTVIPDQYDPGHRELILRTDCPVAAFAPDATYINVAAHAGTAWVTTPRELNPNCTGRPPEVYARSTPFQGWSGMPTGPQSGRSTPAIEFDFNSPVQNPTRPLGSGG
jgi:hypothetical protein